MLRYILLDLSLFSDGGDRRDAEKDLMWILQSLCVRNQNYLKSRPHTPRLYKSGVVYEVPQQFKGEIDEVKILRKALGSAAKKRDVARALELISEVLGGERFRDFGRLLERGSGDCDNIACARVAELRQAGIKADPYMTHRFRLDGGTTYHALVLWPPFGNVTYRTSEDPSLLLGMGGEARAKDRAEEIRKNAERCDIIRKYGVAPRAASLEAELDEVFGLRGYADVNRVFGEAR
jgi:hypothetical protein